MKTPPKNISPFHNKPNPSIPWSVGIEPIYVDPDHPTRRDSRYFGNPLPHLQPASDPLNLAHRIKSDRKMEALLLITSGSQLLYEERVIHPGGGTYDNGEDGADGGGLIGSLLSYAVRRTVEHFGVQPSKLITKDSNLAFFLEVDLDDLEIDAEWEEVDPDYAIIAYRRRWVYQLEGTTPYPIAMPMSWMSLGIDPLELGELLDAIAECYGAVAARGFKESVASFEVDEARMLMPNVFILAGSNMREPVSFTFVQDIAAWQEMSMEFLDPSGKKRRHAKHGSSAYDTRVRYTGPGGTHMLLAKG